MKKEDIIVIPHSLKTETSYFNDEIEVLIVGIVLSRTLRSFLFMEVMKNRNDTYKKTLKLSLIKAKQQRIIVANL